MKRTPYLEAFLHALELLPHQNGLPSEQNWDLFRAHMDLLCL
jgi:hypothetical protein